MNGASWLVLVAAYASGFVVSALLIEVGFRVGTLSVETGGVAALATVVFGTAATGILFRNRKLSRVLTSLTGAVAGAASYTSTRLVWPATDPAFRHAIPFELLPLFVFPSVFGIVVGVSAYLLASGGVRHGEADAAPRLTIGSGVAHHSDL